MWALVIVAAILTGALGSNIYFPEDVSMDSSPMVQELPMSQQIQQPGKSAGDTPYSKFMDDIISQGVTNLCLAVDRTVANVYSNQNNEFLVYSPVSIASVLSLVLLGSNGKTFEELSNLLGLAHGLNIANYSLPVHGEFGQLLQSLESSPPRDTQQIKFATAVFVQNDYPIRDQYRSSSLAVYKSEITNLDFRRNPTLAKNAINSWVFQKTMGKIDQIMAMDPPTETKVVLVSSLYFKSEWDNPFDTGLTKLYPFYQNGKDQPSTNRVNLMVNGGEYPYYNDSLLNCQILGLPYKGKTVTFYIVIPHNSDKTRLRELENRLTAAELKRLVASTRKTDILAAIPKMKLTSTIQLNQVLQNLGLRSLFDPREADLSLLSPGYVPNVVRPEFGQSSNRYIPSMQPESDEEPFVFATRMGNLENKTETRKRRKRQAVANIKGIISPVLDVDSVRHMLNSVKEQSNPGLYADQVLHKVFVDVNEKGTEAAAATGVSLTRSGNRILFKAEVPFFFFIHHEQTKLVLFWGSVNVPAPHYD